MQPPAPYPSNSIHAMSLPTTLHDAAQSTGLVPIDLAPFNSLQTSLDIKTPARSPEDISSEVLGTPTTLVSSVPAPIATTPAISSLFAGVAIAAGFALLAWAAWHGTRRSRRASLQHRTSTAAASPAPQSASHPQQHAQLLAAADQIAKQLDARAAQLERVLAAADARIAQLERPPVQTSSIPQPVPAQRHTPRPAPALQPTMAEAKPASSESGTSTFTTPLAPLAPPSSHRDVYDLADEGLTPVQIAQRLAKPTGQVELILNLRKAAMST